MYCRRMIAPVVTMTIGLWSGVALAGAAPAGAEAPKKDDAAWAPAVKPKAISKNVRKGLDWLVRQQLQDGAWGQGEESRHMGSNAAMASQGSVADTCMAVMALMRAGSTPSEGRYKTAVRRGVDWVLTQIEAADKSSMWVTSNRSTRVQGKLGRYVDTFVASTMLAELSGVMGSEAKEARLDKMLKKVLAKMERNQRPDGTYGGDGWAPVLSQAMANTAINKASQKGVEVSDEMRRRVETWSDNNFEGGDFAAGGSAGVGLYAGAAVVGSLSSANLSNAAERAEVQAEAESAPTEDARKAAKDRLVQMNRVADEKQDAQNALMTRLSNPRFRSGFGSNGGEEFLSYMLVSESLVAEGGEHWKKWDRAMTQNLGRVQNGDGSWTGHHCITGRTFCTSAALMVLLADRALVPMAGRIRG